MRLMCIAIFAVAIASPVAAQLPACPTSRVDSVTTPQGVRIAVPPPSNDPFARRYALSQVVRYFDGAPVDSATVIITTPDSVPIRQSRVALTDSAGRFSIDSLCAGIYDMQVLYPGADTPIRTRVGVDVGGRSSGDILVRRYKEPAGGWTLLGLALYGLTILLARWHHIARSVDEMLRGQLLALLTRIRTEMDPTRVAERIELETTVQGLMESARSAEKADLKKTIKQLMDPARWSLMRKVTTHLTGSASGSARLDGVKQALDALRPLTGPEKKELDTIVDGLNPPPTQTEKRELKSAIKAAAETISAQAKRSWRRNQSDFLFWEFMFWSRGRENAKWVTIHEIERQLTAFLAPPERVNAYLHRAEADLRVIGSPPALAVADAARLAMQPQTDGTPSARTDEERKAVLANAISIIYAERDTKFSTLMEWHNKASWLILASLIVIGFLAFAAGHAILFLAGGAGGFLSRVARALKREDVPLDYGASWTTLFLSPLFGALAGWFGVALITLATQPQIELLGAAFRTVNWNMPTGPFAIAVAFLLGFSERFFDAVAGALERQAEGVRAAERVAERAAAVGGGLNVAPRVDGGVGRDTVHPPSSVNGVTIAVEGGPFQVHTVSGSIVLDKPAESKLDVVLKTDNTDFQLSPATTTIDIGARRVDFHIVPKGTPAPAVVRVTGRVGTVEVSQRVEFVA